MTEQPAFRPRTFAVVGAGPVGCIVAAFLARQGYQTTLCDIVPALLEPARNPGIRIEGAENLTQIIEHTCTSVDDLAAIDPDVIFVTVKANALPLIASALDGFHRDGRIIISWQNGIDTELELARALGRTFVMRAVVNYGCGLIAPGHVRMPFHHPPHYLQELDAQSRPAADAIARILTECGLETQPTQEIVAMIWRKSIMNASMNPVCAVTGMTMAQAMNDPMVFHIVDSLLKECIQIARANEINLGWNYYPFAIDYLRSAGDHKPSMLMDIENRRRTEIDYINGKFVEYGAQADVKTPFNTMMKSLVKAIESK